MMLTTRSISASSSALFALNQLDGSSEIVSVSRSIPFIDVPEPIGVSVEFAYLAYDITEGSSTNAGKTRRVDISFDAHAQSARLVNGGEIDNVTIDDVIGHIPKDFSVLDEALLRSRVGNEIYTGIYIQDYSLVEKSVQFVDLAAAKLGVAEANQASAAAISQKINTNYGKISQSDKTVFDEIIALLLREREAQLSSKEDKLAIGKVSAVSEFDNVCLLSTDAIADIASHSSSNPFGPLFIEMQGGIDGFSSAQSAALAEQSESLESFSSADYEFDVDPIRVDDSGLASYVGNSKIIGYLVERIELSSSTSSVQSRVIAHPGTAVKVKINDFDIALGKSYAYGVSTLALIEMPAAIVGDGVTSPIIVLAKSRVKTHVVDTIQPFPSPPTDLQFFYDNFTKKLLMTWSNPVDATDIKKFQIFRRETLDDRFSLIRQYDFDNGNSPKIFFENVDYGLDVKLASQLNYYFDETFSSRSDYIYAICAVNSIGCSSGYSAQFRVSLNETESDISVLQVVSPGAPKPYPNFYLKNTLSEPIARITNPKAVTVYFTPEVYNIQRTNFDEFSSVRLSEGLLQPLKLYDGSGSLAGSYSLELTELTSLIQKIKKIKIMQSKDASDLFDEI